MVDLVQLELKLILLLFVVVCCPVNHAEFRMTSCMYEKTVKENNDLRVSLRRLGDLGTHNLQRDQGHYELVYEIIVLADKIVSYF